MPEGPLLFCDEEELVQLYSWLDDIPGLSRERRNITRDFADGVMAAEVVNAFLPQRVEVHNYQPANSKKQKLMNWSTLNKKVLNRFHPPINIPDNVQQAIVNLIPGVVDTVMLHVRVAIVKACNPRNWRKELGFVTKAELEQDEIARQRARMPQTPQREETPQLQNGRRRGGRIVVPKKGGDGGKPPGSKAPAPPPGSSPSGGGKAKKKK